MKKILCILLISFSFSTVAQTPMKEKLVINKEIEWKKQLSSEAYRVLREKGTEPRYSGVYNLHFEKGEYNCKGCGEKLFDSTTKFESSCGWPSFDNALEGKIIENKDFSAGMVRTEIVCSTCKGHLGHVFNDGPTETGLRYCVNSISLDFIEDDPK
ncbi:MAG: Peptide methionine sulfoxide reductase MsrB [Flavobacteriaceae bacterium]|nr:MAG: Peptide methionine sulfoxide reductase MsrB [Flavobacteriaceae bacterium]